MVIIATASLCLFLCLCSPAIWKRGEKKWEKVGRTEAGL
jgi:hypothetical protein